MLTATRRPSACVGDESTSPEVCRRPISRQRDIDKSSSPTVIVAKHTQSCLRVLGKQSGARFLALLPEYVRERVLGERNSFVVGAFESSPRQQDMLHYYKLHPRGSLRGRSMHDRLPRNPPAGLTWHAYLVQLLHIASAIEHALMVQYLYAAYSLDDDRSNPKERAQVTLWRNLILSIAKEEMGHLLTVQNILCLLGGQMELVRRNSPWDSGFYPFEFRLEPLTVGSLACYIYAEMGDEPPRRLTLLDKLYVDLVRQHLHGRARQDAKLLGLPRARKTRRSRDDLSAQNVHKVGAIYRRIINILRDPNRISDSLLHRNSIRFQASADEWSRGYGIATLADLQRPKAPADKPSREFSQFVDVLTQEPTSALGTFVDRVDQFRSRYRALSPEERDAFTRNSAHASVMIERVATRQQALDALSHIAAQGEGHLFQLQSHFGRFSLIMDHFQELRAISKRHNRKKKWEPWTHAVAIDPYVPWPDEAVRPTPNQPVRASAITHPASQKWAYLFNLRYRMLLTYLSHAFQLARDGGQAQLRGVVMHKAFAEMYNLKAIAAILVRLPLTTNERDKRRAGPPFQMPYTLATATNEIDRWRVHHDLLTGAVGLVKHSPELNRDQFARTILEQDEKSCTWIKEVIAGLSSEKAPLQ